MQIISIKNKSIDVSVLLNEESEDFFTNFVNSIKDSPDLTFDQKTNILKLTKRKSLETSLNNITKAYDNLFYDDKEKFNQAITNFNYDLNYSNSICELKNSFILNKISEQDLFKFFVYVVDTNDARYFLKPFKLKLGKSKTVISVNDVQDITFPTKSQWELIKKHIKNL
jgi:hypothetical protein